MASNKVIVPRWEPNAFEYVAYKEEPKGKGNEDIVGEIRLHGMAWTFIHRDESPRETMRNVINLARKQTSFMLETLDRAEKKIESWPGGEPHDD